MASALASASCDGSSSNRAATPSAQLRVGTTLDRALGHRRDLARRQHDVGVVGQDQQLVGVGRLDGLEQLAGRRVGALPAADDPEGAVLPERRGGVGEDRGQAVGRRHDDDPEGEPRRGFGGRQRRRRRRAVNAPSPAPAPTNAAAFDSRTSWAWLSRFSIVIRDSVPTVRPYAITASGRSLWTWTLARSPSPATSTESPIDSRCAWIAGTSSGMPRPGAQQVDRLVAELALLGTRAGSGPGSACGAWTAACTAGWTAGCCDGLAGLQRPAARGGERPLEQAEQALAARVDDVRLAQDRAAATASSRRPAPPRRRVAARTVSTSLSRSAAATAAADASRMTVRIVPSTGLATALYAVLRAEVERMGEVEAVEPALAGQAVRDPGQDLARDHARVAARAHQRAEARRLGDPLGVRVGPGPIGLLQRRPDRRQHVGAGVAVGDREDVERVDLVDVRLEARDRAPERREEPGAVARPAGHQATSVPLPARSEVRGSCVAGAGWATGAVPGLVAEVPDADRDAVRLAAERVARSRSAPRRRPGARPRRPAGRRRRRGRGRSSGSRRPRAAARDGRCPADPAAVPAGRRR